MLIVWLQVFEKQIVIDARGHLLGRLASIVAKQVLSGTLATSIPYFNANIGLLPIPSNPF